MEELFESFFKSGVIDAATFRAVGVSIAIAEGLVPVFFGFTIVYDFVLRGLGLLDGDRPAYFSKKELARIGAIMFITGPLYIGIFYPISTVVGKIADVTSPKSVAALKQGENTFYDRIQKQKEEAGKVTTPDGREMESPPTSQEQGTGEASFWDIITGTVNWFYLTVSMMDGVTLFITEIVKTGIKLLAFVLTKILFVVGPLAIAFSTIPVFKDKFGSWFGIYLNVLFTPITLNLLDWVVYGNIAEALKGTAVVNPVLDIVFNIVIIVSYCLIFWLTSMYVGSSSGGRVLSTATTGVVSLASMAMGNFAGAGAAAAGGASKGGNIIEDSAATTQSMK